jgi:hypothetical protein
MEAHPTIPPEASPRRRWPLLLAVLAIVALAAAAVWFFAIRDDGESKTVRGPASAPFTLTRPDGWESLSKKRLSALPGHPLAVLRQKKGNGAVVVNVERGSSPSLSKLSRELESKLKQKIPDFKFVGSRTVTVKAGQAQLISYARAKKGTANSLLVVPAGGKTFSLSVVVPASQRAGARDAAKILSSFDVPR